VGNGEPRGRKTLPKAQRVNKEKEKEKPLFFSKKKEVEKEKDPSYRGSNLWKDFPVRPASV